MKFLVDEAMSWRVAQALATAGHDVVHVRDLGLEAADDSTILDRASNEERVVVTQDTDFGTLLAASVQKQPSVILLRIRDGRPEAQSRLLLTNLDLVEEDLHNGAIVVMNDTAIRVRRLPL